jgi:hypothetical protein
MTRHKVPTHLNHPDGMGKLSFRQIYLLGAAILFVLPGIWERLPKDGPALGDAIRAGYPGLGFVFGPGSLPVVPILVVTIVGLPFLLGSMPLDPPLEHGLLCCLRWVFRTRGYRDPEKVAKDLGELVVVGNRVESNFGFHAAWEMPTVNLRLADTPEIDRAEDLNGELLTGLSTPIHGLVRATRVDAAPIVSRIEKYAPPRNSFAVTSKDGETPATNARKLGIALRAMVRDHHLIERRHYLSVMGADEHAFSDSVDEITDGTSQLGLPRNAIRRLEGDELRQAVQATWSNKMPERKRLGPLDKPFNAVGAWYADGDWHAVVALGKWPRVMPDNALAPIVDGPYEVDVSLYVAPVDADEILGGLERRSEALKVTDQWGRFRKRMLAIEDLDEFIIALESGQESAFDVQLLLHVHGPTKKGVEQEARRIGKRIKRSGGQTRSLPWEQADAIQSIAPLALNRLEGRTKRVDTSSAKNLYLWTASSMWMDGAVPLGETLDSRRPVGLNSFYQPVIPNPHMAVYALTGGGKGFLVKILTSRELFSGMVQEIFAFDQATDDPVDGEYGKWARYCGLDYRYVKDESDFEPTLRDLDNYRWLGPGIVFNIAQLPIAVRPAFLAEFKKRLWTRAATIPANRKWLIDELWSFVKMDEKLGCDPRQLALCLAAIEDLVRTGRHLHVGGLLITQRLKDSLDVPLMAIVQEQCGIQCYGLQNTSHISDVADRMHWTPADVRQIKKFSSGEWIIDAGPWHVAMKVTHANDEEYEMANTDNLPQAVAA